MLRPFIACALIASTLPASAQNLTDEHFFLEYGGPSGDSNAIVQIGRKIYVGGGFLDTAGRPNLKNLSRFNLDTETWEQVPGIDRNHNNFVRSLHVMDDGTLIVGGDFTSIGGVAGQKIARFDPMINEWSQLFDPTAGDDSAGPLGSGIESITSSGDYIYVGADLFWNTDDQSWKHIRRFNTTTSRWTPVGEGLEGDFVSTTVQALITDTEGNVYAGGEFARSGNTDMSSLAKWDGSTWSEVGGGVDGIVRALTFAPDGRLFVGGQFTSVGGQEANNLAAWNGSSWDTLNGGVLGSDQAHGVWDISIDATGRVYVGGEFDRNDTGTTLNNAAIWDGTGNWKALGSGLGTVGTTHLVQSVLAIGEDAYFAGQFSDPNGSPNRKKFFARWNPNLDFTDYIPGLGGLEKSLTIEKDGTDVLISFNTISGVRYYLQRSDSNLGNWSNASGSQNGVDGRRLTFTIPIAGSAPYYRVKVE